MNKKELSIDQAAQLIEDGAAVFVDIRAVEEIRKGAINNSFYLPQELISTGTVKRLGIAEDRKIIFYCRSGARSGRLVAEHPELHGGNAYSLAGGLLSWQRQHKLGPARSVVMDLIRQTHITVGLLILGSLLLGSTLNSSFYLLTACFGGGLLFAGLSGTCMMANLLAKMPWNQK